MERRHLLASMSSLLSISGCLRLRSGDGGTPSPVPTRENTPGPTARETEQSTDDEAMSDATTASTSQADIAPLNGTWPQFHFDAANTGYVADGTGPTESVDVVWRHDFESNVTSSPVVADGTAFVTVRGESPMIVAIDTEDGSRRWSQPLNGTSPIGGPAVDNGRVYVATTHKRVYALNADAGSFVWQAPVEGRVFSAPTVAQGSVLVSAMNGTVHALDASSGDERWRYQPDVYGMLSTPAVTGDTVYVSSLTPLESPGDGNDLFEFNPPPRFFMWNDRGEDPMATIEDLAAKGTLHAVTLGDGTPVWTRELPDFVVSSPAVGEDSVYVGCWDGRLHALNRADGTERWSHETDGPISGTAAIADGTIYVGSWDGNLYGVTGSSGRRVWFLPLRSKANAPPAVVGETIYAIADNRGLFAVDLDGRERWMFKGPIGDYNASAPAVLDGSVLVCGDSRKTGDEKELGALFRLAEAA